MGSSVSSARAVTGYKPHRHTDLEWTIRGSCFAGVYVCSDYKFICLFVRLFHQDYDSPTYKFVFVLHFVLFLEVYVL